MGSGWKSSSRIVACCGTIDAIFCTYFYSTPQLEVLANLSCCSISSHYFWLLCFSSLCIQLIIYRSDFYVLKLQRLPQLCYGKLSLSGVLLILVKLLEVILLVRFCPLLLNNSDSIKVVIFYMSRHNKCKSKKLVRCWHHVFNKQYRTSIVVHIKVVRRNLLSLFKSSILLRYNA